ncbi:MAG: SRPBCC domain-containing protein [Pseudomonadota bacterium]
MNFLQSIPGEDPIVVEGYFPVTPQTMFKAWTEPDKIKKWFGMKPDSLASAQVELREGGAWRFLLTDEDAHTVGMEGEYLEIVQDEKLVFSWTHVVAHADGTREETPASRVEVSFSPKGSGTWVHLIHSGIAKDDARKGVGSGWTHSFGHIMDVLSDLQE